MLKSAERVGTLEIAEATRPPWARTRALVESGLLIVGLVALLLLLDHHVYGDAEVRYQSLTALLADGKLVDTKYSLIGPLFSAPIWYIGGWLHLPHRGLGLYNWCVFTAGVGALYWLLRDRIERGPLRAFLLLLITASLFPFHLTNYYGEVFTAVTVAVGVIAVATERPLLGWPAIVLGVANSPATLPALGLLVLVRIYQTRRLRHVMALVATVALIGLENWLRRGNPLATNYESGLVPPLLGLLSILFSFGKGLIFFVPGLFLPVRRALDSLDAHARRLLHSTHALWAAFVIGLVATYASWYGWDGGWFWGPRFFLFASFPACLALALRLRHSGSARAALATLAIVALSVWVAVNGAVYGDAPLFGFCVHDQNRTACNYMPQYSMLWFPFLTPIQLSWRSVAFVAYCVAVLAYLAFPLIRSLVAALLRTTRQLMRSAPSWRL